MNHDEYLQRLDQARAMQAAQSKPRRKRSFPAGASAKGSAAAAASNRRLADEAYRHLFAELLELRARGLTLAQIAARLNARGEKLRVMETAAWSSTQVGRVLRRAQRIQAEAGDKPAGPS